MKELVLSIADIQQIGNLLGELRYKDAAAIVNLLNQRISEQSQPAPEPTPATETAVQAN